MQFESRQGSNLLAFEIPLECGIEFGGNLNRVHSHCYSFRVKIHGMCNAMVN